MNGSFIVFAGVGSIALAPALSTLDPDCTCCEMTPLPSKCASSP